MDNISNETNKRGEKLYTNDTRWMEGFGSECIWLKDISRHPALKHTYKFRYFSGRPNTYSPQHLALPFVLFHFTENFMDIFKELYLPKQKSAVPFDFLPLFCENFVAVAVLYTIFYTGKTQTEASIEIKFGLSETVNTEKVHQPQTC